MKVGFACGGGVFHEYAYSRWARTAGDPQRPAAAPPAEKTARDARVPAGFVWARGAAQPLHTGSPPHGVTAGRLCVFLNSPAWLCVPRDDPHGSSAAAESGLPSLPNAFLFLSYPPRVFLAVFLTPSVPVCLFFLVHDCLSRANSPLLLLPGAPALSCPCYVGGDGRVAACGAGS